MLWLVTVATAAKLHMMRVVPPPDVIDGLRTIQVGRITGHGGDRMSDYITQALKDPQRQVGLAMGRTTRVDEGLRIDVFEVVTSGGDAVIDGSIDVSDEIVESEAQVEKKDEDGNVITDDEGNVLYDVVTCKKRVVNASIRFRVTAGGEVKAQGSSHTSSDETRCGSDMKNLATKEALADVAIKNFPYRIVNQITPVWSPTAAQIERDKTVKQGFKALKNFEWQTALCSLHHITETDPYNVVALYDLGVVYEAHGWNTLAAEVFQKAVEVNQYKHAVNGLDRVERRKRELAVLERAYGQTAAKTSPDYSRCDDADQIASKGGAGTVLVKKPTKLLSGPEVGAPSMANLPKGMRLKVVSEDGPLLKVETLDGTQGWVLVKHIKR